VSEQPVIRIDALWLCTQPQDMRAGADRLLAVVVNTVGRAQAHHGWLFANARATRVKLLVHDGFGVWCATRRLHDPDFRNEPANPVAMRIIFRDPAAPPSPINDAAVPPGCRTSPIRSVPAFPVQARR
jgi:hypothetical protein